MHNCNTPLLGLQIAQLAACHGKEQFTSSAHAKKALKRIARRKRHPNYNGNHNVTVESYKCPHCSGWHIGRKKRDAKR